MHLATAPRIEIDHEPGRAVTVTAGDTALLTYRYHGEPRLHPVRALSGAPVAAAAVTWRPPPITGHPALRPATAEPAALTDLTATPLAALAAHRLTWSDQRGRMVVDEWRALTASLADGGTWVLLFENTMTNVAGRAFTFTGEAGPCWPGPDGFTRRDRRAGWGLFGGHGESVVVVGDSANPLGRAVTDGQTVAYRYAAVVAAGDQCAESLAGLGREALAAEGGHGCAGSRARNLRRGPFSVTRSGPADRGRRPPGRPFWPAGR
jgi:hypothetical protein